MSTERGCFMGLRIKQSGDFRHIERFCKKMKDPQVFNSLFDSFGRRGCAVLASATPVDSGITASSWRYKVVHENGKTILQWSNDNVVKGVNIAIILQYGHGTRNGGYVQGRDYINPAIRPIMDAMARELWTEVQHS